MAIEETPDGNDDYCFGEKRVAAESRRGSLEKTAAGIHGDEILCKCVFK